MLKLFGKLRAYDAAAWTAAAVHARTASDGIVSNSQIRGLATNATSTKASSDLVSIPPEQSDPLYASAFEAVHPLRSSKPWTSRQFSQESHSLANDTLVQSLDAGVSDQAAVHQTLSVESSTPHRTAASVSSTSSSSMSASHPQTSQTPHPWNDGRLLGKMLLKGDVTPGQLRTARLLRRYNYSLPELQGQTITATVLRVTPERVYVDPGFFGVSEIPRDELTLGHILSSPEGSTQAADRLSLRDVRVGDVVKVRVDEVFTPYGDMQLEATKPDPEMRRRLVWRELTRLMQAGKAVEGRGEWELAKAVCVETLLRTFHAGVHTPSQVHFAGACHILGCRAAQFCAGQHMQCWPGAHWLSHTS